MKPIAAITVILVSLLSPMAAMCANKSAVEPQVLSLPKGPGSIEGLGESFEPQLNTGTATYSVKLAVSPGVNQHQPELALIYNSGYGNSPLGIGWRLNIPYLQRQTDKGLPSYTDADIFIHSDGGELVPLGGGLFRLKIEGLFLKLQRVGDGWEVWEKNGTHHYFGTTAAGRLETPRGTFEWCLEKSVDTNGNEIRYFYYQHEGQIYLQEIRYSLVSDSVYKSVHFRYEDRADAFTDYHSRSRILTARRLAAIEMRSQGALVRKYQLSYQPNTDFSLLAQVVKLGTDGVSALPPFSFEYSAYSAEDTDTVSMTNPPPVNVSLTNSNVDLIDIDGDGLPDLVRTDPGAGVHSFYLNQGRGVWEPSAVTPAGSPQYFLSANGVMMSDMNGDGLADLFVKNDLDFGYFKNRGQLAWEESAWTAYSPIPGFSFEDAGVRLLDLDNDKLIDVLRDNGSSYQVWLNPKDGQWSSDFDYETDRLLDLTNETVKIGDMNGDRMEDVVHVLDGYVSYFPSMGNGQLDSEVEIDNPPSLGSATSNLTLADINNDGLADLALIGNETIRVWFNGGNGAFKPELELQNTPAFDGGTSAFRFADMNGDGFRDLLITNEGVSERYQYVTFNNGVHPNLLTKIRNGLGRETTITYRSSIEDYLNDRDAGNPWTRKLPFPVQVVSRTVIKDNNSGQEYMTDYTYRDGYYDGEEKEFRGFSEVRKLEHGEPGAPGLLSRYSFDVGDEYESRKGMVQSLALLEENGTVAPPAGLFEVADHTLTTRTLFNGTNDETVTYSFTAATGIRIYEGGTEPKELRREWSQDDYGNVTEDLNYGIVAGSEPAAGDDEVLTYTEYRIDEDQWIVDRPSRIRQTDLAGGFVSLQRFTYDANGNLILDEQSPDGADSIKVIRNDYDEYGNIVKITDANNHWRRIDYDATFHSFPIRETIGGLNLTLAAGYDLGLGVMTLFTDANGNTTTFGYDTFGRLTAIVKPGDTPALPTQAFSYNLVDPVSSLTVRSREQFDQPGTYDTVSYFDGLGRKLQTRSEGENGAWVVAEAAVFNQRKGVQRQWLPFFAASVAYGDPDPALAHNLFEYDARGRSVKETNPDGSYRSTVYRPLARMEYDEEDNHPGGPHQDTPHTFSVDGRDRLVEVRERNGGEIYATSYGYDGLDNLVEIIDDEGNVKSMEFDGLSRKTFMDDPDKGVMTYEYDGAGNLTSTTDAKGQTVSYTYDAANRTRTERHQGVLKVHYRYDDDLPAAYPALQNTLGRLAWVEDEAGEEMYSYDARGNMARQVRKLNGLAFLTQMEYDAMDRLTRLAYPDGVAVEYAYNAMNQLDSIPGFVDNIDYIATGQKAAFRYANGIESRYDYDSRQRLTHLHSTSATTALQDLAYSYDTVSNITRITDQRADRTPEDCTTDFAYDDLYRLTEADAAAAGWSRTYEYNSIGNMTFKSDLGAMQYGEGSAGPHALTGAAGIAYSYDANGNLAAKAGLFDYQFDPKDRLARVDREADGAVIGYAYDYQHNRKRKNVTVGDESAITLYVDRHTELRGDRLIKQVYAGDRLVARVVVEPFHSSMLGGWAEPLTVEDFDVNPKDGVITVEEIQGQGANSGAVEYAEARDALRIYQENREANPGLVSFGTLAQVTHELGDLPQPVESRIYFYLPDHLGSASVVMDASGAVVEESVFYPYGQDRVRNGDFESEYRFTGKELDGETGLHYFGARYYDSVTGRFVSVDPFYMENRKAFVGKPILINLYRYGANNPIGFIDPNGLFDVNIRSFRDNTKNSIIKTEKLTSIRKTQYMTVRKFGNTKNAVSNFEKNIKFFLNTPISDLPENQRNSIFVRGLLATDNAFRKAAPYMPEAHLGISLNTTFLWIFGASEGIGFEANPGEAYTDGSSMSIERYSKKRTGFSNEIFDISSSIDFSFTLIPKYADGSVNYVNIGRWTVGVGKGGTVDISVQSGSSVSFGKENTTSREIFEFK